MHSLEDIIFACWIIFVVYWVVTSQSVKPVQEVGVKVNIAWSIAGRIFFAFLFLESFGDFFPLTPLTNPFFVSSNLLSVISVLLVIVGVILSVFARMKLKDNWSSDIDVKKKHELMTTGIYRYMRHPIYTGIICMCLGTFLFTRNVSALLFLVMQSSFMYYKLREEEKILCKHFSKEYPQYMKKTKALIPFIW